VGREPVWTRWQKLEELASQGKAMSMESVRVAFYTILPTVIIVSMNKSVGKKGM